MGLNTGVREGASGTAADAPADRLELVSDLKQAGVKKWNCHFDGEEVKLMRVQREIIQNLFQSKNIA